MNNIPKALIVSQNFNPGHCSHIVASYKQMRELGYESVCYVHTRFLNFLPNDIKIIQTSEKVPPCNVALIMFPSIHNLSLIRKLKKQGTIVLYVFHEPLAPFRHYREAGFSNKYLVKLWIIDHINALTVKWSTHILIPSFKAMEYYGKNTLYNNNHTTYLPLLYDDESIGFENVTKHYFSYIGTVAADHSFNEFLNFAATALEHNWLPELKFMIATKSDFEVPDIMKNSPRVKIIKGTPLTDQEINEAYASSAVIWNAYTRTTQSGVLAKAYMFGTPALVLRSNLNEFMMDGQTVVSITDNQDKQQIQFAVSRILPQKELFIQRCRKMFIEQFYYRNHNETVRRILCQIEKKYEFKVL